MQPARGAGAGDGVDLRWTWLAVLLAVTVPALVWLSVRRHRAPEAEGLLVAHAARLRTLPRYRELARARMLWTVAQLAAAGLVLLGGILLAARPTSAQTEDPPATPGDLVICLDLSPHLRPTGTAVLAQVRRQLGSLVDGRVALYGYQSTTAELMPMTDDHGFVRSRLADTITALSGLGGGAGGTGNTGDGLVSCARHFDRLDDERGRSVLLVSDGRAGRGSLHTPAEAGEYAAAHDVVVYAIAPARAGGAAGLKAVARMTGGRTLTLSPRATQQVLELERDRLDEPPAAVRRDAPVPATVLVFVGLAGLLATALRGTVR